VSISTSAEVFVYQPIIVKGGHTYKFSVAMPDISSTLSNDWIEFAWVTNEPQEAMGIKKNPADGLSQPEIFFNNIFTLFDQLHCM
jgi:hypothetical protein